MADYKMSKQGIAQIIQSMLDQGIIAIKRPKLEPKKCTCDTQELMLHGCKCGAMDIEKHNKEE